MGAPYAYRNHEKSDERTSEMALVTLGGTYVVAMLERPANIESVCRRKRSIDGLVKSDDEIESLKTFSA